MFGNNPVQSSWSNPQNTQQQGQQQPAGGSVFGQPNAFGSGGAFGSGSAFGQPQSQQQQQQPQTNPMFGNIGSNQPSTGGSTFGGGGGAFGGGASTASTSAFGAAKPATGFGAFGGGAGGGSTFGSGGAFGSTPSSAPAPATGGGLFGQAAGTSSGSAFGGGGLFGGSKPATSTFGGATAINPQAGPYDGAAPVTTGTASPPYSVFSEKDSANANITLQYQSITCMPQYRGTSFEELRWQDYQQGRKTAGAAGGAFGQPTAFQPAPAPQQPTGTMFGTGQTPQTGTGSAFGGFGGTGAPTAGTGTGGAFGGLGGGTGAFGAFGQQQGQQPQQQQTQPTSGFGAFGQPQQQQPQQPSTGGLFGGGAFGQTKPAGTFGTGGAFGGGGAFGQAAQQQPQQQQQQAGTGTGLFGQPQQPGATGAGAFGGGGAFGAPSTAPKTGLFGATQPAPSTGGFGLFGGQPQQQQQQQQPQQQAGGGLFGGFGQAQPQQPQAQPTGGLFGATPSTQQPQQPTGGLFGGTAGGGGLFGGGGVQQPQPQPQQQQPPQAGGFGLFGGAKPAAPPTGGGLFGGGGTFGQPAAPAPATQPSGGLFGGTLGQPTTQAGTGAFGGGGLFGAKPTAPALGVSQAAPQPLGASLFGTSTLGAPTAGQPAPGSLQASIAQPVTANLPIFSMLPSAPSAPSYEQPKKKSTLFEPPPRTAVPRSIAYQPPTSKLRGYTSTISPAPLVGKPSLNGNLFKPNGLGRSTGLNLSIAGGPEAFGAVLGSGTRASVKKLILDKKVDASELLRRSSASPSPGKPSFNPALSTAVREKEAASRPLPLPAPPSSPSPAQRGRGDQGPKDLARVGAAQADGAAEQKPQEGDYWTEPPIAQLAQLGFDGLAEVRNLKVGRIGYGEIEFLDPVDLTTLTKLSDLLGEVVRFDDKECCVYPDSDDVDKPPPGNGLNVPARITLCRCWALDKATREPIKDANHPSAIKHLKRLKNMKGTSFDVFGIAEGKWTFTVEHF